MAGFDELGIYHSANLLEDVPSGLEQINRSNYLKRFKDFIKNFCTENFNYIYRDQLRRNYDLDRYWLEISLEDITNFDEEIGDKLWNLPTEIIPLFETAAKEVVEEIILHKDQEEDIAENIQIILNSRANPKFLRDLKSSQVSKLIKLPGIIISASSIRTKAIELTLQCRNCKNVKNNIPLKYGLDGYSLPRKCDQNNLMGTNEKCPYDPYTIVSEKCKCVDFQTFKLQETPEDTPTGEMPRHILLYCDRNLIERVVPGNKVNVLGIYSIKKYSKTQKSSGKGTSSQFNNPLGVRNPYLRVLGFESSTSSNLPEDSLQSSRRSLFPIGRMGLEEKEMFLKIAKTPDIYEILSESIAPSIFGFKDIKKAILCLLFGGSRKQLPDGIIRRGDINVLLLGDPGTAKSQLLKFVSQQGLVPLGAVYTSGKGSSAAGLTASVIKDPHSRNFIMEGGAMVLADGGVVCIDEFDKMREEDRVAIHEAMEQQTISIAKAGITTTLNSRCSVLAAANSVFGRWDDTKGDENINFLPTILSRFDLIFIIKDTFDKDRDIKMAKHVINVHSNNPTLESNNTDSMVLGKEFSLDLLRRYIRYCKNNVGPRLSDAAADKLKNAYVMMRNGSAQYEKDFSKKNAIPITIRQLEAIIRISESLAKMKLCDFVSIEHVDEALRLFQVSTLEAAMSGNLIGVEGFTTQEDQETLSRIEKQMRNRFAIGSQISQHAIVQDFLKQKYNERSIHTVIQCLIRRGELQHRMQRKMLYRIK
ncbi:unnamed protein product [Gordionus sp. m RMFG-2023]|uniref:DNA replication licensing factor mcm5-like n=1 Tax=Gordionus sp. m RMFG-2023 TaxID=3053472 RepID=UPI0030DEE8B1